MPCTIYAHLTWATHQRAEIINSSAEDFLRRFLPAVARRHSAEVLAVGMVRDHIHLLLVLPSVNDIPRLVQGLKGASARIANRDRIVDGGKLRWGSGYDLRSVSPTDLVRVMRYVEGQPNRHPELRIDD